MEIISDVLQFENPTKSSVDDLNWVCQMMCALYIVQPLSNDLFTPILCMGAVPATCGIPDNTSTMCVHNSTRIAEGLKN